MARVCKRACGCADDGLLDGVREPSLAALQSCALEGAVIQSTHYTLKMLVEWARLPRGCVGCSPAPDNGAGMWRAISDWCAGWLATSLCVPCQHQALRRAVEAQGGRLHGITLASVISTCIVRYPAVLALLFDCCLKPGDTREKMEASARLTALLWLALSLHTARALYSASSPVATLDPSNFKSRWGTQALRWRLAAPEASRMTRRRQGP